MYGTAITMIPGDGIHGDTHHGAIIRGMTHGTTDGMIHGTMDGMIRGTTGGTTHGIITITAAGMEDGAHIGDITMVLYTIIRLGVIFMENTRIYG